MKAKENPKNYCTLYLVRHGETEWNLKGLVQGHSDIPLNKKGEEQARELAKKLRHRKFAAVFSSDLLRAKRTAQIIALEKKIAVETKEVLRERYFGRFEGKHVKELDKGIDELVKLYGRGVSEEIENNEALIGRLIPFLREAAVGYPGKNILVVTHGGIMRALLIHLGFGRAEELPAGCIANTAYIKLLSDGVDFFIKKTFGVEKKLVKYIDK